MLKSWNVERLKTWKCWKIEKLEVETVEITSGFNSGMFNVSAFQCFSMFSVSTIKFPICWNVHFSDLVFQLDKLFNISTVQLFNVSICSTCQVVDCLTVRLFKVSDLNCSTVQRLNFSTFTVFWLVNFSACSTCRYAVFQLVNLATIQYFQSIEMLIHSL